MNLLVVLKFFGVYIRLSNFHNLWINYILFINLSPYHVFFFYYYWNLKKSQWNSGIWRHLKDEDNFLFFLQKEYTFLHRPVAFNIVTFFNMSVGIFLLFNSWFHIYILNLLFLFNWQKLIFDVSINFKAYQLIIIKCWNWNYN